MTTETTTLKIVEIERETDKAVRIKMPIAFHSFAADNEIEKTWSIWLPKSQIEIQADRVTIPQWLCAEKTRSVRTEAAEYFRHIDRSTLCFIQAR